jgi:hypothetical protein
MSKRKLRDSDPEEHGIPRSVLRDLDAVEKAKDDLRGARAAIDIDLNADLRSTRVDLDSVRADLYSVRADLDSVRADLNSERASLAAVRSAAVSARDAEALIPKSAIDTTNRTIANTKAMMDRVNASLRIPGIGNIAKANVMVPTIKYPMLEQVSRLSSLVESINTLPQSSPLIKSLNKTAERLNYIGNLPAANFANSISRIGPPHAAMVLKSWQSAFGANDLAHAFTPAQILNQRISEFARRMGTITAPFDNTARHMMSAFDVVGRVYLSGMREFIERIDLEALERAARVQEARRPRTRIGFAALEAYDAFYLNRPGVVDRFLTDHLGIQPSHETRQALWQVLREAFERRIPVPATWIMLDDKAAIRYLRVAVYNEVRRARRDQEMTERIWWPEGEAEEDEDGRTLSKPALCSDNSTLDFLMPKAPSPEILLIPSADPRGQVLQMLYVEGTEQDHKIVGMLIAGYDLPAIAALVGWAEVQRFQRKAQRWIENKL